MDLQLGYLSNPRPGVASRLLRCGDMSWLLFDQDDIVIPLQVSDRLALQGHRQYCAKCVHLDCTDLGPFRSTARVTRGECLLAEMSYSQPALSCLGFRPWCFLDRGPGASYVRFGHLHPNRARDRRPQHFSVLACVCYLRSCPALAAIRSSPCAAQIEAGPFVQSGPNAIEPRNVLALSPTGQLAGQLDVRWRRKQASPSTDPVHTPSQAACRTHQESTVHHIPTDRFSVPPEPVRWRFDF